MDQPRQEEFVNDLVENVRKKIVRAIMTGRIPSDWDGHELRVLLAEHFEQSAAMSEIRRHPRQKRARDYRNALLVNNL